MTPKGAPPSSLPSELLFLLRRRIQPLPPFPLVEKKKGNREFEPLSPPPRPSPGRAVVGAVAGDGGAEGGLEGRKEEEGGRVLRTYMGKRGHF